MAIAYGATRDPALLSIAARQGRTVLTPAGEALAAALASGGAKPWPHASRLLGDGPDGKDGALVLLRSSDHPDGPLLVAKNTAQGMGHRHFDRLNWLYSDDTGAVVTDYGAARFLNVEAGRGGRYLPENDSWASQSVAHNTLVVDEQSHFGGKWQLGDTVPTRQLAASLEGPTRYSIGEIVGAYKDVQFHRALLMLDLDGLPNPLVLDILRPTASGTHRYDLPLHFSAGARYLLVESGANDPEFNLRRGQAVIQRLDAADNAVFVSLLEPHGEYDAVSEAVVGSSSRIAGLEHRREGAIDIVLVTLADGRRIGLAVADESGATTRHSAMVAGRRVEWTGPVGRLDITEGAAK